MFEDLISQTKNATEQDFRLTIMNALLRTPHREIAPFIPLFRYVHDRDPLFFAHLGAWYFDNGTVRDLKQLFVAFLAVSSKVEPAMEPMKATPGMALVGA